MTNQDLTTALFSPQSASSKIKRRLPRKKRLRIYDALQNLDNELSGVEAIIGILSDKAQYCLDLCIDAGVMIERARDEREILRTALLSKASNK